MACLNMNQNMEELCLQRDQEFKEVLENESLYKSIIFDLYSFYQNHKHESHFKKMFVKESGKISRQHKLKLSKVFLVYMYQKMIKQNEIHNDPHFWLYIQKSPSRNLSGVNSFAILLSPHPDGHKNQSCKHNCYYCPNETIENGSQYDMPRSYLKQEPAVQRGYMNEWDPIKQMNDRMNSLMLQGHEVDKLELIIEGGTYTEFPMNYLLDFHCKLFYSANTFFDKEPKRHMYSLKDEMMINVTTKVRIIGICIETRPDAINDKWLLFFRQSGTTRIQLGVQHNDNTILKKINRGHSFEDSCRAVEMLKNNGFKVDIHLMPDLPFSSPEKDKKMFDVIFKSHVICPDQVKIYPCEVTPYTVIEKWYKSGKYTPYDDKDLLDVIEYGMKLCPPYVRLPRVVRDIPLVYIEAGNKHSNLRQMIHEKMNQENHTLNEMRSREIGRHIDYMNKPKKYTYYKYKTPSGIEYFICLESKDKQKVLFGFLRLRITNEKPYFKCLNNKGLIRELHVYNHVLPVGQKHNYSNQHKGIGKQLLKYAEYIAWFHGKNGVAVISGEGVRNYYRKQGYKCEDSYEIKKFTNIYHHMYIFMSWLFCLVHFYYNFKL